MRILVAGLTGDRQYVRSMHSFYDLNLEKGDDKVFPETGMRGDVARIAICNEFLNKKEYDALMMCDLDMILPKNLVERLRAHDLDMVSAHYFKRQTSPIQSVCAISPGGIWPFVPLYDIPDEGLIEVAVAGFGAVLIKREVIEAVKDTLLDGQNPFAIGPMPEMTSGEHGNFGSDYYFFTRARNQGYKLWLDCSPDLECYHYTTIVISRDFYRKMRPFQADGHIKYFAANLRAGMELHGMEENELENRIKTLELRYAEAQQEVAKWTSTEKVIYGQLYEARMWLRGEQDKKKDE